LSFLFQTGSFRRAISEIAQGININNLRSEHILDYRFKLPPRYEQCRIVAKIEELFSELDKGIESLRTARGQLKIYRQSLLKAAFEGKLTEEWRNNNSDSLQPAKEFLNEVRQERVDRYHKQLKAWEGEVGQWQAAGKKGKKPAKPRPIREMDSPSPAELEALGALPLTWCWAKIGEVSSVGTGVTPLKSRADFYEKGDIPWVTSGALNDSYVSEVSGYVTRTALAETNLRLYPKHTLLMAMYGEGKTRGKCSELLLPATINQAIAAMVQSGIEEKTRPFLKLFLIKNYADIRTKSLGGVQPNLNLGTVENTFFPLCSIAEMREIDSELQRQFSVIEASECDIELQLDTSNALRRSILKEAFCGRLVSQDSNDEPASALLDRIAKQKEEAAALSGKAKAAMKKKRSRGAN
jgi:type I restriction enzyme S subunit